MSSTTASFGDDEGHRRIDPIRSTGPLFGKKRAAVEQLCSGMADRIAELDRQLLSLSKQRRTIATELKQQRRRLWPRLYTRGRAPGPDGSVQLPPVPTDAHFLWGRRLRSACRALLARLGETTLVELHATLHRLGYAISSRTPVKALADALGYDADEGHVVRVRRGVYALPPGARPPRHLWRGGPVLGPIPPAEG